MMKRLALPLLCLALLSACETTSAAPPVGPSEVRIDQDHYRVSFRGRSGTSADEARDRALLHAAELAAMQGYDWMRVAGRTVDLAPATSPRISIGIGAASFGRRSSFGGGVSEGFGGEATYVASLDVQFGRGPKPNDPTVYDARGVIASLGPILAPPPPRR